jgi:hypothetical protein
MKKKKVGVKKSQRASNVYNKLPTKVTRKEFTRYIKPHLKVGARGQAPTLSYYRIFNHILYVLHTGIQWENLPERDVHWTNVYKHHNRWSKDGSYERIFNGSLALLDEQGILDFSALHGDGSNVVAKKGAPASATRATNTSEARNPLISKTIRGMSSSRASRRP